LHVKHELQQQQQHPQAPQHQQPFGSRRGRRSRSPDQAMMVPGDGKPLRPGHEGGLGLPKTNDEMLGAGAGAPVGVPKIDGPLGLRRSISAPLPPVFEPNQGLLDAVGREPMARQRELLKQQAEYYDEKSFQLGLELAPLNCAVAFTKNKLNLLNEYLAKLQDSLDKESRRGDDGIRSATVMMMM
jgi:hypothetical protein